MTPMLQEYKFFDGNIWFLRFSTDPRGRILACGSQSGVIYIWDLVGKGPKPEVPRAAVQSLGKPMEKMTVSLQN
jgi:hypothetical protein